MADIHGHFVLRLQEAISRVRFSILTREFTVHQPVSRRPRTALFNKEVCI